MSLLTKKEDRKYINVLSSDGTLRLVVPEETEGSVRRDYETSDGKRGTKYELVFSKIEGKITSISIFEGDYGKSIHVGIENGNEAVIFSLGMTSAFGEDFAKKLKNIKLDEKISFEPFSFENDKGKSIKGLSIKQNGKKIKNWYFDSVKGQPINGLPEPEIKEDKKGKKMEYTKDDWKIYFLKVRSFLTQEVEEFIKDKFPAINEDLPEADEETDPDQIPF